MSPQAVAAELDLPFPATREALLALLRRLGIAVAEEPRLGVPGLYLRVRGRRLIIVDRQAPAFVLAHELWHDLVWERREHSQDEEQIAYTFDGRADAPQERDAHEFARLLCGPMPASLLPPPDTRHLPIPRTPSHPTLHPTVRPTPHPVVKECLTVPPVLEPAPLPRPGCMPPMSERDAARDAGLGWLIGEWS